MEDLINMWTLEQKIQRGRFKDKLSEAAVLFNSQWYQADKDVWTSNFDVPRNYARLFNNESMSTLQNENGNDIVQDESKGLLSLLDEIIIHIIEKLNSEDIANIADTCIRLREIVRKMTAGDESLSDFSIESIDELDCK